jgi:RNA polymerase sigma factor (TIGR02999 family)
MGFDGSIQNGDQPAEGPREDDAGALLALVYGDLRRIAAGYLRQERPDHTLQPTALVHEAWCRLAPSLTERGASREEFVAVAATTMRHILVDHARARNAAKRGGTRDRIGLEHLPAADGTGPTAVDLLALDEALRRLQSIDARQARLVELRFFGGLSLEEAAALIGFAKRTADREWACARAWLWNELRDDEALAP